MFSIFFSKKSEDQAQPSPLCQPCAPTSNFFSVLSPVSPCISDNIPSFYQALGCEDYDKNQKWANLNLLARVSAAFKPCMTNSIPPKDAQGEDPLLDKLMLLANVAAAENSHWEQPATVLKINPPTFLADSTKKEVAPIQEVPVIVPRVPSIKSIKFIYRPMLDSGIDLDPSNKATAGVDVSKPKVASKKRKRNEEVLNNEVPMLPVTEEPLKLKGSKKRKISISNPEAQKPKPRQRKQAAPKKVEPVKRSRVSKSKNQPQC